LTTVLDFLFSGLPADRLEYHRNAAALVPEKNDPDPGVAMLTVDAKTGMHRIQCNCGASDGKRKCPHVAQLSEAVKPCSDPAGAQWLDNAFRNSPWYRMAAALHRACPVEPEQLAVEYGVAESGDERDIRIIRGDADLLAACRVNSTDADTVADEAELLLERTCIGAADGNPFHRGSVLRMLSKMTLTETEHAMQAQGIKNRRQALEESFWYRLAYHFRNMSANRGVSMDAYIEEATGRFMIRCADGHCRRLDIAVPANAAMQVQRELEQDFRHGTGISLWPESLESIVRVSADESNNLRLTLYLLLHLPDGSSEAFERSLLKKYWYKDTVYMPERRVLATWKKPDRYGPSFGRQYTRKIKQERLPEVIEKLGDIFAPPNIIDPSANRLKIHREYSRIEIDPKALERDWCWLSLRYGFGENISVSLSDIYSARMSGQRYLPVDDGWVDTRAMDIGKLTGQPGSTLGGQLAEGRDRLRLSRMDLLRLQAAFDKPFQINASQESDFQEIQSILEMRPRSMPEPGAGMSSPLRQYQQHGARWLGFLHENRLGGLLCDEMGLGKTHQVMALMGWLAENNQKAGPFLVVCPTTVISHWERKIRDHAPMLRGVVYHGAGRERADVSAPGTVLITSYGILLRDLQVLKRYRFSAAAFDEAHYIKNPATKSYAAAAGINAELKVAVTGTPVENRLGDLKALMDLVLPGYLGPDEEFSRRYETGDKHSRAELQRMVRPFTLRRVKTAVLEELPEKIEDVRYCRLTEAQVRLYREAVAERGKGLREQLSHADKNIPYIHIFALLTLLKQICNHPATVSGGSETALNADALSTMDSGKWELFVELLGACLENGQKVVVFSQFVSMVNLILKYLEDQGVQAASITGHTRDRGKEIERFNNDPKCRVFVGSLKAGGSGIDLTGGSVVIHYDRWWNAAKEDQATDRAHRIGQTRGVQVFKLVTEGTLEEKISAIVDRKKNLLAQVIAEDDPGALKAFTRDELLDLMAIPQSDE